MKGRLPPEDAEAWYRQFWPWFLIMLPASVVIAGFTTLYIANRYSDDLVVDEYYKDGLAINRQLIKKQRAEERGIAAKLAFNERSVSLLISGPVSARELHLLLSHPLESDRDFPAILTRISPGHYQGSLRYPVGPRWHWTLELREPEGWRLDGSVEASDL